MEFFKKHPILTFAAGLAVGYFAAGKMGGAIPGLSKLHGAHLP